MKRERENDILNQNRYENITNTDDEQIVNISCERIANILYLMTHLALK